MVRYLALLRGINVGGKNLIRMVDLRVCLERHGLLEVTTYIQSGNVLFTAKEARPAELARRLEALLAKAFDYRASVVLRTHQQLAEVVRRAPRDFGVRPAEYRYDVLFLKEPLTAATAFERVPTQPGVDQAHAGEGVLYFSRLVSKVTQSKLSRIVALPIYQSMTRWRGSSCSRRRFR